MFDKFHEECGVAAIYGHPEAANLSLSWLSTRCSIAARRAPASPPATANASIHKKSHGPRGGHFHRRSAGACPARWPSATRAIRPPAIPWSATRSRFPCIATKAASRSRTTATSPTPANCARSRSARLDLPGLERHRSDPASGRAFAREGRWPARCAMRCCSWKARFRWCFWPRTASSWRAIRRASGRSPWAAGIQRRHARYVFASETCAFDLINAVYLGDVQPGEMVIVGPEGRDARALRARSRKAAFAVRVRARLFLAARFDRLRPPGAGIARESGPLLAREAPADADIVVPVPDSGNAAALGYSAESGLPFRQALIRNHYVGRTFIEPSQAIRDFGVKLKLNPVRICSKASAWFWSTIPSCAAPPAARSCAWCAGGRARSAHAHLLPAHHFAVLLWRGYAEQERADRGQQHDRRDPPLHRSRFAGLSVAERAARSRRRHRAGEYCYACYTGNYPTSSQSKST
jgi:amidophosphoribosyltransferase